MIENYYIPGYVGIETLTIGGTFIVGGIHTYSPMSTDPNIYKTHKSSVLLGNVSIGRKSKKYFKYNTFKV